MYTIIINDDLTLTTSVKTNLIHNTSTDEIVFLWKDPSYTPEDSSEASGEVLDDGVDTSTPQIEKAYTGFLHYETDNILKTEPLVTDTEPYKDRVRMVVPRSSVFFRNRGRIQLWIEMVIDTTTTTTDPDTGETTVETVTNTFCTLPTTLFIKEVPRPKHCPPSKDEDNTIRITRGDSLTINIILTDNDGFPYEPVEGDEVWFTVKKSAISEDVLIRKSIDITSLELDLVESDTKDLAFGNYKYEVECITTLNDHYTVIKNAPFIITEELH